MGAIDSHLRVLSAACELAEFMSDISEERYAAGWMQNCEYDIWQALNAEGYGGWWHLDDDMKTRLRRLSDDCKGWVVWDHSNNLLGEMWVPMERWLEMYAAKGYPR